jgi:carbon starvation protein CstA
VRYQLTLFFPSSVHIFIGKVFLGCVKSYLRVSSRKTGNKTPSYVDMIKRASCIITYH